MSKNISMVMAAMTVTTVAMALLGEVASAGLPGGMPPLRRPIVRPCTMPDQVSFCGTPGTSKTYDFDAMALLEATKANAADFQKLVENGRRVFTAKVEILPSVNPALYSVITQYTFTAGERGGFLGPRNPKNDVKLVLRSYFDKRIQDDTPTIWESSGVLPNAPTPATQAGE